MWKCQGRTEPLRHAQKSRADCDTMFFAAIDVEEVIDHLHADMATLGTCSLVSRAWVRPCRYHMFRELYLPVQCDRAKALLELLDSEDTNYIAPFIHELAFYNCVQEYSLDPFSDLLYVLYDCNSTQITFFYSLPSLHRRSQGLLSSWQNHKIGNHKVHLRLL